MLSRLRNLIKPDLRTLNTITISRGRILHNLETIKKQQPRSGFFPVLKSNAYGHGILQILEILKGQEFPYLAVDSYPEYQLIHKHSNFNVLLMGETLTENYRFFDFKRTAFAVYNLHTLEALAGLREKISIHFFLNTGMNREGVQKKNLPAMLACLKANPQLQIEGVMSHLHSADQRNHESIVKQIQEFKSMFSLVENAGFSPKWKHIGASAGLFQIQDSFFNAYRPGLALYGYSPFREQKEIGLQSALSLYSTIIAIQQLEKDDGVSYNQQRKAGKSCKIATIPFGYYEGWHRELAGTLSYRFEGEELPQLGTICMNLSSCLANQHMQVGDQIELISCDPEANNSIESIAKKGETIPYEILIRLDKGMRRVVID